MERFYKLSEKYFVAGEFDELFCEYNGYKIEISYSEEYKMWECDAFDLKAEEYVFYPVLRFPDEDKTKFNDIIQLAAKYIEEKVKSNEMGSENILIYIRDEDNYEAPYDDYLNIDAITKYNMCIGLSTDTVGYYFRKCINDSYANWDFYRIEYPNLLTIHYHTWDNTFQIPRYVKKQITIKMEE